MVKLGGINYKVGELDLGDWAEIERRAKANLKQRRAEKLEIAKMAYGSGNIPAEVFREIVKDTTKKDIDAEVESVEMSAFILIRIIKKKNPEMNPDDILAKIRMSDIAGILEQAGLAVSGEKKTAITEASEQSGQQQ